MTILHKLDEILMNKPGELAETLKEIISAAVCIATLISLLVYLDIPPLR